MPGMLSTSEAAALAGTSRFTVEREIRRGNLEAEKVSGRWLIAEAEAKRWAASYVPFREQHERHETPPNADGPGNRRPVGHPQASAHALTPSRRLFPLSSYRTAGTGSLGQDAHAAAFRTRSNAFSSAPVVTPSRSAASARE